jgi:hypothetical protein
MRFEVYCDESRQDALYAKGAVQDKYFLLGSTWLPASLRAAIKDKIGQLRLVEGVHGEIKWRKVSPANEEFYKRLIDVFIGFGTELRFRCIAVDVEKVDLLKYHDGDRELGFYKFYYQMLHHWIDDFNEYAIYCDLKTNRSPTRLQELRRYLRLSNLSSEIPIVQAIPSHESSLLGLTDVLLGAAGTRLNDSVSGTSAKERVISYLEQRLGVTRIQHTPKAVQKFNVFHIRLDGGW